MPPSRAAAGDARAQRERTVTGRAADRRAVGRGAAADRAQDGPGLRLAAAQGGRRRRRRDRHARARLRAAARRRATWTCAASSGCSPRARRARRSRCGAAGRSTTSPTSRSRRSRSAASRSCGSRRSRWRSTRTSPPAATPTWSASSTRSWPRAAARAPARPADARAVPLRPPGRRARGLPATRARRSSTRSASSPARSCGASTRRSCARTPRSTCRRSCRRARDHTPLVGRDAELDALRRGVGGARRAGSVVSAAPPGIGKTRLAAELAAEVQRERGRVSVRPASRGGAPTVTACARRPTLLVAEDRSPRTAPCCRRGRRARDRARPARRPTPSRDRALSTATARRSRASTSESGGVPRGSTRGRARWARARPARASAPAPDRAAARARAAAQTAEDELAARVVELQAARERAAEPPAQARCRRLPVQGPRVVRRRRRRRLLRPRAARRRDGRAARRRAAAGHRRAVGQRQVVGAARPACWPRSRDGVLPGSDGWAIALMRPGEHPLRALEQAVAAAPDGRLVIAVDQFEELFTLCRDEAERTAFVDALVAAVREPRAARSSLIALRADFYGRCAAYPELWRLLGANHVLVGPMRRDELRRAIELPARRAGLRVDAALVDALVADVDGEPGALPLLSTALLELWQRARRRRLCASPPTSAPAACAARSRGWPSASTSGSTPTAGRAPGASCCGSPATARAAAPSAAGVPLAELEQRDGRGGARRARRRPAGDGQRRRGRGRPRGAAARVAAAARLAGGGRRGRRLHHHLAVAAREWDAGGRDPGELYRGARLAAALDWSTHARRRAQRGRARVPRREPRERGTRSQRRLNRRLAGCRRCPGSCCGRRRRGALSLDQRGSARDEATAADAQRLGRARCSRTTSTARCCSPARASRSTTPRRRAAACSPGFSAVPPPCGSRGSARVTRTTSLYGPTAARS